MSEVAAPVEDPRTDDEILQDLGLPHPDDLAPGDDIKGFLNPVVPDRLRRLALRQLWRSNPVLANVDGLVEYGEDYTDAATVVENLQTLYQVGKGTWHDLQDQPDEAEAVAEQGVSEPDPEAAVTDQGSTDEQTDPANDPDEVVLDGAISTGQPHADQPPVHDDISETVGPTRRRMGFTFAQSD